MATFSIDLITGKPYLFSGDFTNSGMTTFSGVTSVINGLSMVTSRQARLGGTLVCSTILTKGAGNTAGIEYGGDYSASFSNRSLVDKGYVDNKVSGSTPSWNTLTNRPAWLTGATLSAFQTGHTHSQYQTVANVSYYTGTTAPNTYVAKSVFSTYTGTTAPGQFASKANALTGGTNQGSGLGVFTGNSANRLRARSIKVAGSNLSISGDSTSITITGTDVDNYVPLATYQTYTGTTAPNAFAKKADALTGGTNQGSGQGIFTGNTANKLKARSIKVAGNLSISGDSTSITITSTDTDNYVPLATYQTYTGTTAPNAFASKANALTGGTNQGSGQGIFTGNTANKLKARSIKVAGNLSIAGDSTSITISGGSETWNTLSGRPAWLTGATLQVFQTGHTHSYNNLNNKLTAGSGIAINSNVISATGGTPTSWAVITNKPSWLSGNTLQVFQTGHTHSYNNLNNKLSGGTGIAITNNLINLTGATPVISSSAIQLLDTVGGTDVNTISATTIAWTTQAFSGTSLDFTGGSRIYARASGTYEVSYVINAKNSTGSPKNIGSLIRKNGNTDVTPLSSSSFNQNNLNNLSTNSMPQYLISLLNGDYVQLIAFRIGTSGESKTKANGSWIKMKKL